MYNVKYVLRVNNNNYLNINCMLLCIQDWLEALLHQWFVTLVLLQINRYDTWNGGWLTQNSSHLPQDNIIDSCIFNWKCFVWSSTLFNNSVLQFWTIPANDMHMVSPVQFWALEYCSRVVHTQHPTYVLRVNNYFQITTWILIACYYVHKID